MPAVIKTTFKELLPYIRARLVDWEICTDEQIGYVLDLERLPPLMGDLVIFLRPGRKRKGDLGGTDPYPGSGPWDFRVNRILTVEIYTYQALDEVGDSLVALTDETESHLTVEDAVLDALHGFHVTDDDDNELTTGPIEWQDDPESAQYYAKAKGWVKSSLTFAVPFEHTLTTNGSLS